MSLSFADRRLPALAEALDPQSAGRLLLGTAGLFLEGTSLTAVRIVRVRYRPAERATILYEVELDGRQGKSRQPAWVSATLYPGRKAGRQLEKRTAGADEQATDPPSPLALNREAGLVAEQFPHDRRLPLLRRYMDASPAELLDVLAARLDIAPADMEIRSIALVRYRPGISATLRYEVAAGNLSRAAASRSFFVKLNATASPLGQLRIQALQRATPDGVRLNLPIAVFDNGATTVTEKAPGHSFSDHLASGGSAADCAGRLAQALAALHAMPQDTVFHRHGAGPLERAQRTAELIGAVLPELGTAAEAVCRFATTDAEPRRTAIVHGDLKPAHMFHANGACTLIDLDDAGLGDPADDIAALMARLRTGLELSCAPPECRGAALLGFLDTYRQTAPRIDADALRRRLAACYLDACRYAIEHLLPTGEALVASALTLADRLSRQGTAPIRAPQNRPSLRPYELRNAGT